MNLERTVDNERTRVVRAEEIESEASSISEWVANMELRDLGMYCNTKDSEDPRTSIHKCIENQGEKKGVYRKQPGRLWTKTGADRKSPETADPNGYL